jgi:hypothetical protein
MSSEDQKREIAITNLRYAEEFRIHAAKEADRVRQSRIREIEAKIDAAEKLRKKFRELLMRFKNHMVEDQPDEEARFQLHITNAEEEESRLRRELSMITKQDPPRNLSPSEKEVVCWQFVYPDERLKKEMSRSGLDETFVDLKIQLDQWTADARKEYDETTLSSSSSSSSSARLSPLSPSSARLSPLSPSSARLSLLSPSSARLSPLSPSSASLSPSSARLSLLSPSSARLSLLTPSRRLPSTPLPSSFSTSSDYVDKYVFDHLVYFKDHLVNDDMIFGLEKLAPSSSDSSEDEFSGVFAGTSSKQCRIFFNRGVSAIDAIRHSSNVVATLRALAAGCYLDDDDDFAGASAAAAATAAPVAAPVDFVREVATGGPPSMFDRRGDWEQSKRAVDAFLGNTESERRKLNALKENEELKERVEQMNEKKEAKQEKDRKENKKQEEYVKRVIAGREEVKAEAAEAAAAAAAANLLTEDSERKKWFGKKWFGKKWFGSRGGKRLQGRILSRRKNKSHHGRKSKSRRKRQQSTKRNRLL